MAKLKKPMVKEEKAEGKEWVVWINVDKTGKQLQYTLNLLDEYNIRNNTSDYTKYSYLWLLFFLERETTINFKKVINKEDVFYSDEDGKYDLEDELRLEYKSKEIDFDWQKPFKIK